MTMSRKHYRELAAILKRALHTQAPATHPLIRQIADDMAGMLKRDNIHFDRRRFMNAIFEDPE